jgi:flagellar assembly protein FliH
MAAIRKFQFDADFDAIPADPAPEVAVAPEPRYSAEELEAARERAFAEGRSAGQLAAQAAAEHVAVGALTRIAEQAGRLLQAQGQSDERSTQAAIATAVAILRKLQPEMARRNALVEIEGVLGSCLESLRGEPRIVVRVHDGQLDPLRDRLDSIVAGTAFDGRIVLLADSNIACGDCRVEWADGGVERDTARLWRDIDAALARATAAPVEQTTTTD